jgi:hypothetical protein
MRRVFTNTNLLPMSVTTHSFLAEDRMKTIGQVLPEDIGKWMFFYNKNRMDEKWLLVTKLFRENKLNQIIFGMKCSTAACGMGSNNESTGIILIYCTKSQDKEVIMMVGKELLVLFNYTHNPMIYYRSDLQSTQCNNKAPYNQKIYMYRLLNYIYNK